MNSKNNNIKNQNQKQSLKKELTFLDVLLSGIGYILGAGIYALIGTATKYSQSWVWLSFLLAGTYSILNAYNYLYLINYNEKNNVEYHFIKDHLGKKSALLSLLSSITLSLFTTVSLVIALSNYFDFIKLPIFIKSIIILFVITLINLSGLKTTTYFTSFSTLIEAFGLILIIILSFLKIYQQNGKITGLNKIQNKTLFSKISKIPKISNILYSSFIVIFAFSGYESLLRLKEETIDSETNIPKAIIYSIIISTILYMLVSYGAVHAIGWDKLANSNTPLVTVANTLIGNSGYTVLWIISLFAIFNTLLLVMLTNSRLLYSLSFGTPLEKYLSYIDPSSNLPTNSIITHTLLSLLFLFLCPNLENTAVGANIAIFSLFLLVNLSLCKKFSDSDSDSVHNKIFYLGSIPLNIIISTFITLIILAISLYQVFTKMIK